MLQRMHDPVVTRANQQAAVTYVVGRRTAIVDAFADVVTTALWGTMSERRKIAVDKALSLVGCDAEKLDAVTNLLLSGVKQARRPILGWAIRALNFMEQETAANAVTRAPLGAVLAGTEFTFTDGRKADDASVKLKVKDREKRTAEEQKPHTRAEEIINLWTEYARKHPELIPGGPAITTGPHEKAKAEYAVKVTYRFPQALGRPGWTWHWVADIDEACYETQTAPTSIDDLKRDEIKAIIEQHIFGGALSSKCKLKVDPKATGGGGHISLDVASGFGSAIGGQTAVSAEILLTTLVQLQLKARDLQREFNKGDGESDRTNAPWLTDEQIKDAPTESALGHYRQLIDELVAATNAGDDVSIARLERDLVAFNQRLTNPFVDPGKRKSEIEAPDAISHYQAVNIEHIGAPDGAARVEIRDVPAQSGYAKLMADLKVLQDALAAARRIVATQQKGRLTLPLENVA